jgi:phosphate starvation-inducible PhoH-like protein
MQFPKTHGQCVFIRGIQSTKPILLATGPAGSGKTMLACQEGVRRINTREFGKIIFTRPIVTADEDLGYLPGDMKDKMEPWTRAMLEYCHVSASRISVEPLGFMRGRTFHDTFIIADEMQNSTPNQMKMLLTRIGNNSKMVILGDMEQSDLPEGANGLTDIISRVECLDLAYVDHVAMGIEDVIRHPCVSEILTVYNL